MNATRRTAGALGAAFGVGASLVMLAGVANAAPYVNTPSQSASTTNPPVGGSLTFTGDGMLPNEQVGMDLHSTVVRLTVTTADATGQYTVTVKLPSGFKCSHVISATGLTSGRVVNTNITIGNINSCKSSSDDENDGEDSKDSTSHHSSNLPKTGAAVAGTALLGAALIGGGVTLRRRQKIDA